MEHKQKHPTDLFLNYVDQFFHKLKPEDYILTIGIFDL